VVGSGVVGVGVVGSGVVGVGVVGSGVVGVVGGTGVVVTGDKRFANEYWHM